MNKYAVLQIDGGIGKNIIATSVVRAISEAHPERKIVIITAYPDVWLCNPRVYRTYQFGQCPYFHQDYIENKDTILFLQDPYRCNNYIFQKEHLSKTWCDLCGVKWSGNKPEMYFTQLESDFISNLLMPDKPIFLINAFGGAHTQKHNYSWTRDLPPIIAQQVVNEMSRKYRVIQIRRENQIALQNCESLSLTPRQLAMSLLFSEKRLLIDSYLQHASAAIGLPSVVTWVGNNPDVIGYELHKNIRSTFDSGSLRNSMYEKFDITGDPIQLQTPPKDLFDIKIILENLEL